MMMITADVQEMSAEMSVECPENISNVRYIEKVFKKTKRSASEGFPEIPGISGNVRGEILKTSAKFQWILQKGGNIHHCRLLETSLKELTFVERLKYVEKSAF